MKVQVQNSLFMVSEIKVSYQPKFKASERPTISRSKDAYNIFFNSWDQGRIELNEQFKIILLNRAQRVIGMSEISNGGMAGTVADPKLIFGIALKSAASGIILCHNHPSCNLKPSQQDIDITRKMIEAGKLLDIVVLDHIILTKSGYYSFGDEGLI